MCRLGHKQTIGVIAHRLCRLIWKILYQGVRYEERGPDVRKKSQRYRAARMIRELQSLGYRVEQANSQSADVPAWRIFDPAASMASSREGAFHDFYQGLLTKGMKPAMARLTLARKIAAITLILWKKGAHFDAEQLKPQAAWASRTKSPFHPLGIILGGGSRVSFWDARVEGEYLARS
jgi:hypothetical protein